MKQTRLNKRKRLNILYSVITTIIVVSCMSMIGEINVFTLIVFSSPILIIAIWMVWESDYRAISRITATIIGIVTFFIVGIGLHFIVSFVGEYIGQYIQGSSKVIDFATIILYLFAGASPFLAIITGVYVALKWLKRPSKKKAMASTE